MIKELVVAIRYVRERIPGTEIREHMPGIYALEDKLQKVDKSIGEPQREYVKEIWEVSDNEPEPDEFKSFAVCQLGMRHDELVFFSTGYSFTQHIIAEEWIKESGDPNSKYVIFEVIERAHKQNL